MARKVQPLREGFWFNEDHPGLPHPQARDKAWKGKREFLAALSSVESSAHPKHYKGWSTCRLCGCRNGSVEYELGNWRWPVGYAHYVKEHNVRPSLAFQEFVLGKEL